MTVKTLIELLGRLPAATLGGLASMQYLGGKSRIGKRIAQAIVDHGGRAETLWEPFCGGCGATEHLARIADWVVATDAHSALIAMWAALQDGWDPPANVSEADYAAARKLPDSDPRKAFVGFGCSFGGKWFGGYARNRSGANYAAQSRRGVAKIVALDNVAFLRADFLAESPAPDVDVIYCDPPYVGTTGYGMAFDHTAFWARCDEWANFGARVYVSEYTAPDHWAPIWEKPIKASGGLRKNTERPHEKLWVRKEP